MRGEDLLPPLALMSNMLPLIWWRGIEAFYLSFFILLSGISTKWWLTQSYGTCVWGCLFKLLLIKESFGLFDLRWEVPRHLMLIISWVCRTDVRTLIVEYVTPWLKSDSASNFSQTKWPVPKRLGAVRWEETQIRLQWIHGSRWQLQKSQDSVL